jgi:two-component system, LuxR family, response regulator FixJ
LREREVMDLVLDGQTNQAISDQLSISKRTVEVHRASVMEKMECRSLAHLMKMAFMIGLVE